MMEALEAREREDEASEAYEQVWIEGGGATPNRVRITSDTYRLQDDTGTVEGYPVYYIKINTRI